MNLAFQTLTLLFLLFPGIVLRSTYNGKLLRYRSSEESFTSFGAEGLKIVFWTVILQAICNPAANWLGAQFFNIQIDFKSIFFLLAGSYSDPNSFLKAEHAVIDYPLHVFSYFLASITVAAIIGKLANMLVRYYRLDIKTQFFKFNNEWHYLLSGELKENLDQRKWTVQFTSITAIVQLKDAAYLYVGLMYDYILDSTGNLDRLVLRGPVRQRTLSKDRQPGEARIPVESDPRFYEVEGDYFVLRTSEITTLNIEYWEATPPASEQEPS